MNSPYGGTQVTVKPKAKCGCKHATKEGEKALKAAKRRYHAYEPAWRRKARAAAGLSGPP